METDSKNWTSFFDKEGHFDSEAYRASERKRFEAQAREYFYHKKQRKPYYYVEGWMTEDPDSFKTTFIHLTPKDVSRAQSLIIDEVNKWQGEGDITDFSPATTVVEALECIGYEEIFERNTELNRLLGEPCELDGVIPETIHFEGPCYYFYRFSCLYYDNDSKVLPECTPLEIMLTDDQYITLLTMQLQDREFFNFNKLLEEDPELGRELNSIVRNIHYIYRPFLLLFDEVRDDADAIAPEPPQIDSLHS